MFKKGIDVKNFGEKLMNLVMYSSHVSTDEKNVIVTMKKGQYL